jgi:hypothetical protein
MQKENKSRNEVCKSIPIAYSPMHWILDKYGLIAVWYNNYIYGTYINKQPNKFQRKTLELLELNYLIAGSGEPTDEYGLYLKRKKMGIE